MSVFQHIGKKIIFIIISAIMSTYGLSQGIQTDYGKSKVQYGKFNWYFYKTTAFEIYYYSGGKNLAQYVLTYGKTCLQEVEKLLDFKASNRITIIIYNTYTDFKQSNLTLVDEKSNSGGLTPIADNIAFVYFDGNHENFYRRIKESIAEVLLNELIYGSTIQERIQNMTLISLPDWFYKGLISFIGGKLTISEHEYFESGIESERFIRFGRLKPEEKILIGHYFWEYIFTAYGKNAIGNILYLTHINKNVESGFDFVIGKTFNFIYSEWYRFYRYQVLSREPGKFEEITNILELKKFSVKGEIVQIKLSPDGENIAYSLVYNGKSSVWIYNINTQKRKCIFKYGYKVFDNDFDRTYPLLDWHPLKNILTIVYSKKSRPFLIDYDLEKNKLSDDISLEQLNKILDINYNSKGSSIVISGIKDGNSDIFIYEIRSFRLFSVTNDIYDDLNPVFVNNDKGIVFSSNRNSNILERRLTDPETEFQENFDLYYYNAAAKSKELIKVSYTADFDELNADAYDSNSFSYLTNENGIINRNATFIDSVFNCYMIFVGYTDTAKYKTDTFRFYNQDLNAVKLDEKYLKDSLIDFIDTMAVYHDTAYHFVMTNYMRNIRYYDISVRTNNIMEVFKEQNKYIISLNPVPVNLRKDKIKRQEAIKIPELYKNFRKDDDVYENIDKADVVEVDEEKITEHTEQKDSFRYHFINEFEVKIADTNYPYSLMIAPSDIIHVDKESDSVVKPRPTRFGSSSSYFLSFTPDYLVSQFDNGFLNSPYLVYDKTATPVAINRGANAFIMYGVNDLFKDYRISGGFRLKGNLSGAEYLFAFENLKTRIDKKFIFYRKGETSDGLYVRNRQLTHEVRVQMRYPFKEVSNLRLDIFVRQDKKITLSSEQNSLEEPNVVTSFTGLKLEYVFDNTRLLADNIRIGTRYKIYTENFRNFNHLSNAFSVVGIDFRNYTRVSKELIWANRIVFASSYGQSKVVYLIGGIDNWLLPKYNENIMIDPEINYVYKALGVQLRGFTQNIRNGNSYALFNSEIRFPLFKYFSVFPMKSAFFESFQLVAFTDIGTAWTGPSPYSEANSLNKRIINNNPLKITVTTVGEPVVGGFGLGARAILFGYYVKVDHAWGMEGGKIFQHITYVSLGVDF